MNMFKRLLDASSRIPGRALALSLAVLLFAGLVPTADATTWTFSWGGACRNYQAGGAGVACPGTGWPAGQVGPVVYTNAGGSGFDVRIRVDLVNGAFASGTPQLSTAGNPTGGTTPELQVQTDFTTLGGKATLVVEFCAPGATGGAVGTGCTPHGFAMNSQTIKDIDIGTTGCGAACYRDTVAMTAITCAAAGACGAGSALDPSIARAPGSTLPINWVAGGSGPSCATAEGGACTAANAVNATADNSGSAANNPNSWATYAYAPQLIQRFSTVYQAGDGGPSIAGGTNPTAQEVYFSPFIFSDVVTQAVVSNVRAYVESGVRWVEWQTGSEIGTAGFNVLRLDEATGAFVRLNPALLPAGIESSNGGIYRFQDPGIAAGRTYTYGIDEIEVTGSVRQYGPYKVTVGAAKTRAPEFAFAGTAAKAKLADSYQRQAKAMTGRAAEPAEAGVVAKAASTQANTAIRIQVEQDGLYYVTANQIAAELGGSVSQVRSLIGAGKLRLLQKGQSVAWKASADNNQLYFYGLAVAGTDALHTRFNVYWLDSATGTTMNVVGNGKGPAPAGGLQPFRSQVHVEQNLFGKPFLVTDPSADFWYWAGVAPSLGMTAALNVPVPGAATTSGGQVTLTAYLQGATDLSGGGNDHHATVLINGTEVGSAVWGGIKSNVLTSAPFNASLLAQNGNNTVTIYGTLDDPVTYSVFWVNGFDINYPRNYEAADNRLQLTGAGNPVVTVGNFSAPAISVLDISNPRTPRWMASTRVASDNDSWTVSFAPGSANTNYLAAVPKPPATVTGVAGSNLKSTSNRGSYLVLTPGALRTGANALAAYRSGMVVELQDIYDEFNFGIANPNAIRDFLAYARQNWRTKPDYVALIGKGTFDPKDYLRLGTNLFPVLMTSTPYGMFGSDTRYVDFDDNGTPDIAIGRIPALSNADVTNYRDKVRAYESGRGAANQALLVADNPDAAGDFTADSQAVDAALPNSFTKTAGYLAVLPPAQARQTILNTLNSTAGVGLFNYVGHGGIGVLADEAIFSNSDVSLLTNGSRLPIFTAYTCVVGDGTYPGLDSMTETLLWRAGGGAVASFAPTGLSDDSQAHILNISMVRAMYGPNAKATLGDAAVAAIADMAAQGGVRFMLERYSITGDPALRIQK